ncbi:MAG: fibronectin type III domain-containing protein [Propionibacteriaceae bacterium]|nr:fibronectin type III domain-containing protein [Propionibacteriaceae bacterium]
MFTTMSRRLVGVLAALALALGLPGQPQADAAQKYSAPTRLRATAVAGTEARLAWRDVSGAPQYRVRYSTSKRMTHSRYLRTDTNTASLTGLTPGRTYYVRVKVTSAGGTSLSTYSTKLALRTPTARKRTYLSPTGLVIVPTGGATLQVSWNQGSAAAYRVSWADNKAMTGATTARVTGTSYVITALAALTRYYVRVKAVDASSGSTRSAYTSPVRSSTLTADSASIRVASYNVRCVNCTPGPTWYERRDAVVQTILGQDVDVVGLQEASQAKLRADNGAGDKIDQAQFEDLIQRLGSPYKLTNTKRYNCVRAKRSSNCVYADQGASDGTKIVYNSDRLTLLDAGSQTLTRLSEGNNRFVAWAVFRHKASGKEFLFADTHLEYLKGEEFYQLRIQQTKEVLAAVAAHNRGLPSYIVGDFNSTKWTDPDNAPRSTVLAAGFVDPLGNIDGTHAVEGAIVGHRIRTNYHSWNDFAEVARHTDHVNGSYLDYIFTSTGIEVPEWETVVNVDPEDRFIGTIPSDHNMIRATTVLR